MAKYPVVNISYNDEVAYFNWLSENDNSAIYRLPTEKNGNKQQDTCQKMQISMQAQIKD